MIAVNPDKEKEVIEYLKKTEKEIYNTEDFTYTWLTDEVHKLYAQDRQTANIYFVFALIAIIISCLGLFGLSSTFEVAICDVIINIADKAINKATEMMQNTDFHFNFEGNRGLTEDVFKGSLSVTPKDKKTKSIEFQAKKSKGKRKSKLIKEIPLEKKITGNVSLNQSKMEDID